MNRPLWNGAQGWIWLSSIAFLFSMSARSVQAAGDSSFQDALGRVREISLDALNSGRYRLTPEGGAFACRNLRRERGFNRVGVAELKAKKEGECAFLPQAQLSVAQLRGAELKGAELSGAQLHGAVLYGAALTGAKLAWADMSGVAEFVKSLETVS